MKTNAPLPPGAMRMATCPICRCHYYGSEAGHMEEIHGQRPAEKHD
jgi:hypothetical protein